MGHPGESIQKALASYKNHSDKNIYMKCDKFAFLIAFKPSV